MKNLLTLLFLSLMTVAVFGQNEFTQNIKGQIVDIETGLPLIGATVAIIGSDPLIGASTDVEGYYLLPKLPIGRYSLLCSYLGYKDRVAENMLLNTGKELVVNFELIESVITADEVLVTAVKEQDAKTSELATISVQEFDSEVASRYSGSRNDVSRMASGFAGVSANDDSRNDIVIRGNSPSGLLWRLDGMDIPNPSHFGAIGATGGPVSMLNNNLLANSTFLTGAFPANYGNALSGVFDLKVRTGNKDKTEGMGQVSFNGFEFGLEGPFSKKSSASYIVNYRYSVIGLINKFSKTGGATGTGDAVPNYQDLSFKVKVPTKKLGTFSLLGLGGNSDIAFLSSFEESDDPNFFTGSRENLFYRTRMGMIALTNKHYYNNKSYGKVSVNLSLSGNKTDQDNINDLFEEIPFFRDDSRTIRTRVAYDYRNKISVRHTINLGASYNHFDFQFQDSVRLDIEKDDWLVRRSYVGTASLPQAYAQWQYRFNDRLTLNAGLFAQLLSLNNSASIEPRINLKYALNPKLKFTFGLGRHSKIQDFQLYLIETETENESLLSNRDLGMTKSDQVIGGVEWAFARGWNLKTEAYYQALSNIPIEERSSPYSALNDGADFAVPSRDSLVNEGTGTNYGLELTLEKKFEKGFYLLNTVSLFNSTYIASDGVERNTAFNGQYVGNLLLGKEFRISKKITIALDTRLTAAGGRRITPIDLAASIAAGEEVRDRSQVYEGQLPSYFRNDIKFTIRLNSKKVSQEWSMDLQNAFDNQNVFGQSYSEKKQAIVNTYQLGRFPVINYKINF